MSAPTVTIEDCPREDVASVVAHGPVSNRLVLYVRRMMAADRASTAKLFKGMTAPELTKHAIASEVFEMCGLEYHGEVDGKFGTSWVIAKAAGWDHLAGRNPGGPSKALF